jgi:2-polyprenyl-3-methyl-5-hydroxy-6-metoxy-1,4-benzoquinol methylase
MQTTGLDAQSLSMLARAAYGGEQSAKIRLSQRFRPYICPLGSVIEQVPQGARVLDVGCGAGLLLLLLAQMRRIGSSSGFDVSQTAIAAAQGAAARSAVRDKVRFAVRAIEDGIPREDCSVVTVVDVVHHVPTVGQQAFVEALCAAVPPGGRLIIKDMVAAPRWRSLCNQAHDLMMARQFVQHVGSATVERWGERSGFTAVHRSQANTLWYGHWMLVLERR